MIIAERQYSPREAIDADFDAELEAEVYFAASREHSDSKTEDEKQLREVLKAILIPLAEDVAKAKGEPTPVALPYQRARGEGTYTVTGLTHTTPPIPENQKKYTGIGHVMQTEVRATGPDSYQIDRINIYQVNLETGERVGRKSDFHIGSIDNFVKDFTTGNADSRALRVALNTVRRMANELPNYEAPQEAPAV